MNRGRITEIARWEFLQKVKSKAFIVSLILFPVFMLGFGFVPALLVSQGPSSSKEIGIVDRTASYALRLRARLESGQKLDDGTPVWMTRMYSPNDAPIDTLLARAGRDAREEKTEGFLEILGTVRDPHFIWRTPNLSDLQTGEAVRNAVRGVVTEQRIKESGVDSAELSRLTAKVDVEERKLTDEGESEGDAGIEFMAAFFTGIVGIILFMMLIMTTGQSLVRGLVEEKSNRIMEILVGSSTPTELMWGKLFGLSALGLTQVFAWGFLGSVIGFFFSSSGMIPGEVITNLLGPLPWVLLYLALGYFFYAAIFLGAGSLVTTEQEAQLVTQSLTMLLVAPVAFAVVVTQDPNAPYIEALSYVPLLTPTLMMLRVVVQMPPVGTLLGTTLVLILSAVAVTWIAAKIFRTAILLYGKRPSVREVVRWLRA
ncbi:MAG: ABC transporter permease [Chlorobi bacterium]|nr:ABC transporter permease [Chlorobiota bacterium]